MAVVSPYRNSLVAAICMFAFCMFLVFADQVSQCSAQAPATSPPAQIQSEALASDSVEADSGDGAGFLRQHCVGCHGSELQEADLRLDELASLPSQTAQEVWHDVYRQVSSEAMPPEESPQPSVRQRQKLLDWIIDEHGQANDARSTDLWSLKPPRRPAVPSEIAPNKFIFQSDHPIDAFVLDRLHEKGLSPSGPADRTEILRRVTLDLTGLPPTLIERQDFFADTDDFDRAYGRVVDRLLSSPRYGERSAQHWMDVIRWAETVGFETNAERTDAWHYRDWVIDSFNDDKPYDQFLSEQLIGDETGEDAALGFLVAGPANLPGQIGRDDEAMRQARQDELDEVIRTVSQTLFGLTVGCARCHDHKFDPISQRDYYSMQAVFAGLKYGYRRLRGPINDQWARQVPETRKRLELARKELESMRQRFALRDPIRDVQTESFAPVVADAVRMEIHATNSGPASLYEFEIWSVDRVRDRSERTNVALASSGALATASSFALANQTRHFDNLVDGSVDRRQAFPWVAASPGDAWIQVDLSMPITIDKITWHGGSSVPVDYEIKVRAAADSGSPQGRWLTVADTRDRLPRIDDRRESKAVKIRSLTEAEVDGLIKRIREIRQLQRDLSRLKAGPQTYAASFSEVDASTMLLRRGDPMSPESEVFASVPEVLVDAVPQENPSRELGRRKLLVDHLVDPNHPLTARVMVNRLWQQHFGTGIVETSSDFGSMGQPPTHPDLLDYLACELIAGGWSIKSLHRLIVTSSTYTQSSRPRSEALKVDAGTRYLWRYPPRRLDAESIRDSILLVSGQLNRSMHGRGFDFFNQRGGLSDYRPRETFDADGCRRMIYGHKIRMQPVDVFGVFDCPDAGQMTPRRSQSITPIQSLSLFNSPFVIRQSRRFADRITELTGGDLEQSISFAFEIALGRVPGDSELQSMIRLASVHGLEQVCRVILNTSEFVSLQ